MFNFKETKIKTIGVVILAILTSFLIYKIFYKLTHRTDLKFIVQYDYVPAINKDINIFRIDVHYRGYDVGDVTDVKLSKDQRHIEFYVDIHYKGLKLPANSPIIFKTENIYGARYLSVEPQKKPSGKFVQNGDVIDGKEAYERIDEYLIEALSSEQSKRMIKNLYDITNVLEESLKNKDNAKLLNQSSGDLAVILENLRTFTEDTTFQKDIKSAVKHSSGSLRNINEILQKTEIRETIIKSPETINQTMNNIKSMNESMGKVSQTLPDINKNLTSVNTLLTDSNCNLCTINTKIPTIPQSLVENAEQLVVKTNCFESELSKILSKRFLILRLMFGNPGKSFKTCARNRRTCPKETAKK